MQHSLIFPTSNLTHPSSLTIERGQGVYVFDNQGNRYLEGMAGLWCTSLGYDNQELIDAATAQMHSLSFSHMFGGKTHAVGEALAERIAEMVPVNNAKVFFGNSGSDANDTLLKMVRYHAQASDNPKRTKIIARERSYHGVTLASSAMTGLPVNHQHFDLPFEALGILRTYAPHYYRNAQKGESEQAFVERLTNNLESLILANDPDTIAAFIAEPITGASGVIVPPEGYYQSIQKVLAKYGIRFWADEVITAFGRTGADFGCNSMGIASPSMMTLAKQLSSAYVPISAAVIDGDMYEPIARQSNQAGVFGHGFTYSGHPVACAVALKTLEIYERDNLFEQAAVKGDYLQRQLHKLSDHPLVGEVRGKGLIGAVELVADKHSGTPFSDGSVGQFAMSACQQRGLITRAVAGSSLALCPPLVISIAQIDEMISAMAGALDDTLAFAHKHNLLAA